LKLGLIYKSALIHPFHYILQTNCVMVNAASSKLKEECNEVNCRIKDKDKKQVTTAIKGVGGITTM
jgi:hypothetical protein